MCWFIFLWINKKVVMNRNLNSDHKLRHWWPTLLILHHLLLLLLSHVTMDVGWRGGRGWLTRGLGLLLHLHTVLAPAHLPLPIVCTTHHVVHTIVVPWKIKQPLGHVFNDYSNRVVMKSLLFNNLYYKTH